MAKKTLRQMYFALLTSRVVNIDEGNVPVAIYAGFYLIMSQYFKNIKIAFSSGEKELRLSYFEIEPSRSGKGERAKVMKDVLKELGFNCAKVTRATEAGLIGSINEKALEFNYKNKLKAGQKGYLNPVIVGDLGKYDVLFFEEAKKLLLMGEQDDLLSDLQEVLDYPGTIRKKLKNGDIEYTTTVSLYCTTYIIPEIADTLLKQGFFQRVIFRIRDFTIKENTKLRTEIIDRFRTSQKSMAKYKDDVKEFCDEVKKLNNKPGILYMTDDAIKQMHVVQKRFESEVRKARGIELQIMMSFSQTVIDLCAKIGGITACLAQRNTINSSDINNAYTFVKASANSILNKMMMHHRKKGDDIKTAVIRHFKAYYLKNQEINKEKLINYLQLQKIGLGRNKLLNLINIMINENYFKIEKSNKNEQILQINED